MSEVENTQQKKDLLDNFFANEDKKPSRAAIFEGSLKTAETPLRETTPHPIRPPAPPQPSQTEIPVRNAGRAIIIDRLPTPEIPEVAEAAAETSPTTPPSTSTAVKPLITTPAQRVDILPRGPQGRRLRREETLREGVKDNKPGFFDEKGKFYPSMGGGAPAPGETKPPIIQRPSSSSKTEPTPASQQSRVATLERETESFTPEQRAALERMQVENPEVAENRRILRKTPQPPQEGVMPLGDRRVSKEDLENLTTLVEQEQTAQPEATITYSEEVQPAEISSGFSYPQESASEPTAPEARENQQSSETDSGRQLEGPRRPGVRPGNALRNSPRAAQAARGAARNLATKVATRAALTNPVSMGVIVGVVLVLILLLIVIMPWLSNILENIAPLPANHIASANACFGGTVGNGICPDPNTIQTNRATKPETCQYYDPPINIFGDLSPDQIKAYVDKYYQQSRLSRPEFEAKASFIAQKYREAGLNPILGLGYWKSESGFSTIASASDLGCAPGNPSFAGFEKQVACSVGIGDPNTNSRDDLERAGFVGGLCARSKDAQSGACRYIKGIRETETIAQGFDIKNSEIYKNYPINYPIQTFDDYAEVYGSKAPLLLSSAEKARGEVNRNCVHTYNDLLDVAVAAGACQVGQLSGRNAGDLATCKFKKADQNPPDAPYQSTKLLQYFQDASTKTGVPVAVLGGIVRVESSTDKYSISNYSDQDIEAIEAGQSQIASDIDTTLAGGNKAMCPRSPTGALGLTQIQPPPQIFDTYASKLTPENAAQGRKAYAPEAVNNGASLIGKTADTLTIADFCNPNTSILMGAGFVLQKLKNLGIGDGTKWDPKWTSDKNIIDQVAKSYYGCLKYPTCENPDTGQVGGPNSYGDDLWGSLQACQGGQSTTQANTFAQCSCRQSTTGSTGGGQVSCPVPDMTNLMTKSFQKDAVNGHCGSQYSIEAPCTVVCPGDTATNKTSRRAKAIDIASPTNQAVLPELNGQKVTWKFLYKGYDDNFGGTGNTFMAKSGDDYWVLDVLHLGVSSLQEGAEYPSGTTIGKAVLNHVHATIGKNLKGGKELTKADVVPGSVGWDCDTGWQSSDFMCDGSSSAPATTQTTNTTPAPVLSGDKAVIIDPGHTASDLFKENKADENALNLKVAKELEKLLVANGYIVKITRPNGETTDASANNPVKYYEDLQDRVNFANAEPAAKAFVSVHFDRYTSSKANQVTAYYKKPNDTPSQSLGTKVSQEIAKKLTGFTASNPEPGDYYLLNPPGTETDCDIPEGQQTGTLKSSPNVKCDVTQVPSERLNMPGIIQEIFINGAYDTMNDKVKDIALGYCNGVAQFLDNKNCTLPASTGTNPSNNMTCQTQATVNSGSFFCQNDARWSALPTEAVTGCSIGYAGCGPTTMAMILARFQDTTIPNIDNWGVAKIPEALKNQPINPPNIDAIFRNNHWRPIENVKTCGSFMQSATEIWLASIGYEVEPLSVTGDKLNMTQISQKIADHYLIISSQSNYLNKGIDHIFGISGVKDNQFVVFDPANCGPDGKEGPRTLMENNSAYKYSYAFAVRKKAQ